MGEVQSYTVAETVWNTKLERGATPDEDRGLGCQAERRIVIEAKGSERSQVAVAAGGAQRSHPANDFEVGIDGVQVRARWRELGDRLLTWDGKPVGNNPPLGYRRRGFPRNRLIRQSAQRSPTSFKARRPLGEPIRAFLPLIVDRAERGLPCCDVVSIRIDDRHGDPGPLLDCETRQMLGQT